MLKLTEKLINAINQNIKDNNPKTVKRITICTLYSPSRIKYEIDYDGIKSDGQIDVTKRRNKSKIHEACTQAYSHFQARDVETIVRDNLELPFELDRY
jgi:hypothetical protein